MRLRKKTKILQYLLFGRGYIMKSSLWMLKLGFLTITGCSFWNIFFPTRGGLGPKGSVGLTPMRPIGDYFGDHLKSNLKQIWDHPWKLASFHFFGGLNDPNF